MYGYPSREAAEVASREVRQFLVEEEERGGERRLERVVFCCFEQKDVRAYEEWLPYVFFRFTSFLKFKGEINWEKEDAETRAQ